MKPLYQICGEMFASQKQHGELVVYKVALYKEKLTSTDLVWWMYLNSD